MGQITQITDGKSAWIQSPQGTREVPADAFGEFQRGISLFGGWGLYQQALAGGVKAQYVGQENTADGKNADVVNWIASFGTIKLYFDSATHLLVEAKYTSTGVQGPEEADQRWSDFRAVEGRQFPFQSVTYRAGAKFTDSTVQEIHINPALDPVLVRQTSRRPQSAALAIASEKIIAVGRTRCGGIAHLSQCFMARFRNEIRQRVWDFVRPGLNCRTLLSE